MDYKKEYEQALERAKGMYEQGMMSERIEYIFPELKESEDERIRKEIISFLKEGKPYYCPNSVRRQEWATWLEKQGEQNIKIIQWKGDNLRDVVEFTGKSPKFKEWFKTWDDYENYVHSHGNIFKLFCKDGSHYELPVGAWIVKTPDGYNVASKAIYKQKIEQKPTQPVWKYKKDNMPLLRDSFILNKYGCVAKSPSGALVSDVWVLDFDELSKLPKEEFEMPSEQNPIDKVEPKFKVGDKITNGENIYTINNIVKDCYFVKEHDCVEIPFEYQDKWNLVEPKFKAGDWIVREYNNVNIVNQVINVKQIDDGCFGYTLDDKTYFSGFWENSYRLWTMQDTKDGDVLANGNMVLIFKCFEEPSYKQHIIAYIGLDASGKIQVTNGSWNLGLDSAKPATKEQRDLLFQKMKEAGYEWDAERKELKKIEQKSKEKPKFYDSMDDLIADALIEEIEGSDLDDSSKHNRIFWIKSHRHKPTWSEDDGQRIEGIIATLMGCVTRLSNYGNLVTGDIIASLKDDIDWLKFLKERVQPQRKQEWSKEEKARIDKIIDVIDWAEEKGYIRYSDWEDYVCYVKSLRPQNAWKPSAEQMHAIRDAIEFLGCTKKVREDLKTLYEQLKKLRENNIMAALEKFEELPHINSRYEIQEDWAYTPSLYHFDGEWHVTWVHCSDGDTLDDFSGSTPEEAIDKAYKWFHNKFKNN